MNPYGDQRNPFVLNGETGVECDIEMERHELDKSVDLQIARDREAAGAEPGIQSTTSLEGIRRDCEICLSVDLNRQLLGRNQREALHLRQAADFRLVGGVKAAQRCEDRWSFTPQQT